MANETRNRVICQEKGLYRVSDGRCERLAEISGNFRYRIRSVEDYPAVGDYVLVSGTDDESRGIIESVYPRKSVFVRRAAGHEDRQQVVAANIDIVFICMSLNGNFNARRLERYVSTAWNSGAAPVVVLTKADLCEDLPAMIAEAEAAAPGVDVVTVSSLSDKVDAVKPYLAPGSTVAFLGSSGVGKSTLINALLGKNTLRTGEIGDNDRGRHTTTRRELLALPCGAFVIDTPGMRELGMWENESGIDTAFSDIAAFAEECRFSDCTHTNEPGCAIQAALRSGRLEEERWESYRKLRAENAYSENKGNYLEEKRLKFKQIAMKNKQGRQSGR